MYITRRKFIQRALGGSLLIGLPYFAFIRIPLSHANADENGILHSDQFKTRVVARSGEPLANGFIWPGAPDGAAVFPRADGGWIYVCNSELGKARGSVAALVFNAKAEVVDGYSILQGSEFNCAGGATPWHTWLSCEEHEQGRVWQCDPAGNKPASICAGLGVFTHESVAVDSDQHRLYLTEDEEDGAFYRYTPYSIEYGEYDLQHGTLEACVWDEQSGKVHWQAIADPQARHTPTRYQSACSTFAGAEGVCYQRGFIYFNTKHDRRIWRYDVRRQHLQVWFQTGKNDSLGGADAMTTTPDGTIWVGEDGGDLQVVMLDAQRRQKVLLQLVGHKHSEITGMAFTPDFKRLYFNSQRGDSGRFNTPQHGVSYEIQGDFLAWAKT